MVNQTPWQKQSTSILLIDGPAGVGKTVFIENLACNRARSYKVKRLPLLLHVKSRGRILTFLQDLIAFSLQTLRLDVTYDQIPTLVRRGLITLAIDGFDELGDPNGFLENDDRPRYRRFAHTQLLNYFLSEETIDALPAPPQSC